MLTSVLNKPPLPYLNSPFGIKSPQSRLEELKENRRKCVCEYLDKFPNDLQLLRSNQVHVTKDQSDATSLAPVQPAKPNSYTELANIYKPCGSNEAFDEFDRTMHSFLCLQLIIEGSQASYEKLTDVQSPQNKLSWESFQMLHNMYNRLLEKLGLNKVESMELIESLIDFADLPKSELARQIIKDRQHEEGPIDADDYKKYLVNIGDPVLELFDAYKRLQNPLQRELFKDCIRYEPHWGHAFHSENGESTYKSLDELRKAFQKDNKSQHLYEVLMELSKLVHSLDVFGAQGHKNNDGTTVYTQTVHEAIADINRGCELFLANKIHTITDLYYHNLSQRCGKIGLSHPEAIHKDSSIQDKVWALMICYCRIYESEQAAELYRVIENCDETLLREVWEHYGCKGDTYITYGPAFCCANKDINNFPNVLHILNTGARMYHDRKLGMGEYPMPLNFNDAILGLNTGYSNVVLANNGHVSLDK